MKKLSLIVTFLLALSILLGACSGKKDDEEKASDEEKVADEVQEEAKEDVKEEPKVEVKEEAEDPDLSGWDGDWYNITSFYGNEELAEPLANVAAEKEMTVEDFIAEEKEETVPFQRMTIDASAGTIVFYKEIDGKPSDAYPYKYHSTEMIEHGGVSHPLHIFESKENADIPYILLMGIHGEDKFAHFHVRTGQTPEELIERDDWYPTFVGPEVPMTMIAEELEHHLEAHGDHDHDHDHDD